MGKVIIGEFAAGSVSTPAANKHTIFHDGSALRVKHNSGAVDLIEGSRTAKPVATLTDAATVVWDLNAVGENAKVTLAGNRTLDVQNPIAGKTGRLLVTQDGTGGRTLTLPGVEIGGRVVLSSVPGATDLLEFFYDGTTFYWRAMPNAGTPVDTLTDAATVVWDLNTQSVNAKVTITDDRTLDVQNPVVGMTGRLIVVHGAANTLLALPGLEQGTGITLSTGNGAIDILEFFYDGTTFYWKATLNYA